ncbi:CAP domain-containing protein [Streptomyces sp. NPDC020742]|uniref:CAP domain-containing protein n=1 Tax=Streptomyces sp. NPDC020742 TaxID=3154897 RepID=UPI00340DC0F2
MTKHRRTRHYRKITVAALAVGAVAIPSAAMACLNGPGSEGRPSYAEGNSGHWQNADWKKAHWQHAHGHGKHGHGKHGHWQHASAAPRPQASGQPAGGGAQPAKTPAASPSASTTAAPASKTAARILELVNSERSKAGCSPLTLNAKLSKAAQDHSKDMAAHRNMSHTGSDGSSPGDRITRAGYKWSAYGENVAYGYGTAESVMKGWMSSPGHKRNILDCSFKELGVGLAQPGDYWTQDFGTAG